MKTLITTLLLTASTFSFAGEIQCFFTEPFLATRIDNERTILEVASYGEDSSKHLVDLTFEAGDAIVVTTKDYDLVIYKNIKGNDGMSDKVYDYEGILTGATPGKLYGGCNEVK